MWGMKKILLLSILSVGILIDAGAQAKKSKRIAAPKKTVVKKKAAATNNSETVVLVNTGSNAAYAPPATSRLRIADPTINLFNQRAGSPNFSTSGSAIVGMPKATYGVANGKILFRNTTATSPGTGYGSGAVGTGTALQGLGTSESGIGVNGKSPTAGPWLWGDRRPVYTVPVRDSVRRE
jgi:hypothetical protein